MKPKYKLSALAMFSFMSAVVVGCVPMMPSEESMNQEVNFVRAKAYQEWKAARDRGETREPRLEGQLSVEEAVRLAIRWNKPLQSDVENREYARGYRKSAWGVILPNASLTAGLTITEKGSPLTATGGSRDSYSFGVTVHQPIWQGDKIPATLREAAVYSALVDEGIRASVQDLVQTVSQTYFEILYHQHLVDSYRESLNSAEAQLRMVTEKRKQETATDYEVLTAQVDVATYRASMISEQNAIGSLRVLLLKTMGCSQDSEITLSDKLTFLPMRPVFERAVQIATCSRPDLRQAELEVRQQIEAVRIAESAFFPQVYASLAQNWSGAFRGSYHTFRRQDLTASLNASYDIGIDNWGNLQMQRARQIQNEIALLDAHDEMMREIRTEMNNLSNAEEMINALQVNQDAAREALRLVSVGYEAGVRTEVDVTTARKQLTEVQAQFYGSMFDHTKARIALQVSMGMLGPCYVKDGYQEGPNVPIADIQEFKATDYVAPTPFVSPSKDSADEKRPQTRRRRTSNRDIRGNIRDLSNTSAEDDENGSAGAKEDDEATERPPSLIDRLTGARSRDAEVDAGAARSATETPSRLMTPEERAKSFSEREAERERLQRERQRARDERLNRPNQPRSGTGSTDQPLAAPAGRNGNGNGSQANTATETRRQRVDAASGDQRIRDAQQKAADLAAEAQKELQQTERASGNLGSDMQEAVRQAEEAIRGARDAVRDFDPTQPTAPVNTERRSF